MDKTTAIPYINKLGGTLSPELNHLTKEGPMAMVPGQEYYSSSITSSPCSESRVMKDRTDWRLCPEVFAHNNRLFGLLQVDLFASRLTHQLLKYVSWHPDPGAMACDAFAQDWSQPTGHKPTTSHVGYLQEKFRGQKLPKKLQNSAYPLGDLDHLRLMTHCSQSGPAGVLKGVLIPFQEI